MDYNSNLIEEKLEGAKKKNMEQIKSIQSKSIISNQSVQTRAINIEAIIVEKIRGVGIREEQEETS